MSGLDLSFVCTLRSFLSRSALANMLSSSGSRLRSAEGEEEEGGWWKGVGAGRPSRDCEKAGDCMNECTGDPP